MWAINGSRTDLSKATLGPLVSSERIDNLTAMNALVRLEASNDPAAIDLVLRSAFPSEQEARLVERLRRHQRLWLSLVAEIEGVIAGHIGFSAVKIAGPMINSTGVGLAPLAIVPELQGRGLGAQLVREGLCTCERPAPDSLLFLARLSITSASALEVPTYSNWRMNTARVKHSWRWN